VRLADRIPVGSGPYAVARTTDGALWSFLVHAGTLRRNGSEFPVGPGPQLLAVQGSTVFVSRSDDVVSSVSAQGHVRDLRLPPGTKPYDVAVTAERLWFCGLADVVGRPEPDGSVIGSHLPSGSMPVLLTADGTEGVWGTCFGADALLRWRVGSEPELLPLGGGHGPVGIAADGFGLRWAEITSGTLGLRSPDGVVSRVDLPGSRPHAGCPVVRDGRRTARALLRRRRPGRRGVGVRIPGRGGGRRSPPGMIEEPKRLRCAATARIRGTLRTTQRLGLVRNVPQLLTTTVLHDPTHRTTLRDAPARVSVFRNSLDQGSHPEVTSLITGFRVP